MDIIDVEDIDENIELIISKLKNKKLIVYPTETVAGIGCISDTKTIDKLFLAKGRPLNKSVSYAFSSIEMAKNYVNIPDSAFPLLKLLPGPLTLVLPLKKGIVLHGLKDNTIGIRIPKLDWLLKLINLLNEPLVSTSANISTFPPPKSVQEIDDKLLSHVDLLIKWKYIMNDLSSTVVSFIEEPKILRSGAINDDIINYYLNDQI